MDFMSQKVHSYSCLKNVQFFHESHDHTEDGEDTLKTNFTQKHSANFTDISLNTPFADERFLDMEILPPLKDIFAGEE